MPTLIKKNINKSPLEPSLIPVNIESVLTNAKLIPIDLCLNPKINKTLTLNSLIISLNTSLVQDKNTMIPTVSLN
jgi:hypothetical protein